MDEKQQCAYELLLFLDALLNSLERSNRLHEYEPDVEDIRLKMFELSGHLDLPKGWEHSKES